MENVEKQIVRIIENNSPELAAEEILRLFSVSSSLPSDDEMEKIIDKELERLGYDCTGDKTADFVDGFIRGYEYKARQ